MARSRGTGLVGLVISVLGLLALLSAADLARGRDSAIRAWWADLRVSRGEGTGRFIERVRDDPRSLRGR